MYLNCKPSSESGSRIATGRTVKTCPNLRAAVLKIAAITCSGRSLRSTPEWADRALLFSSLGVPAGRRGGCLENSHPPLGPVSDRAPLFSALGVPAGRCGGCFVCPRVLRGISKEMSPVLVLDHDDEEKELEFELAFLRSLTTQQRFELMFQRSREMAEVLLRHGYRKPSEVVERL